MPLKELYSVARRDEALVVYLASGEHVYVPFGLAVVTIDRHLQVHQPTTHGGTVQLFAPSAWLEVRVVALSEMEGGDDVGE